MNGNGDPAEVFGPLASQERSSLATPIHIQSTDDPRLEGFRALRERDLVGRQGKFIAEGEVVMNVLLDQDHFVIEAILISRRVLASAHGWLDRIGNETPLLVVPDDIMQGLVGFHLHRGILAIAHRGKDRTATALLKSLPAQARVILGCGIANHDNMGGIFRNAAAFGAAVLLDRECCDPFYRKAIRVSVGGVLATPFARGGSADAVVEELMSEGFQVLALSPGAAISLHGILPTPRMAFLLGAEGPGLPPALLARLTTARIDMAPGFDSLNVATGCGIVLHHFFGR